MSHEKLSGHLDDLPLIDNDAFVKGSTKRIVFGPDRFWPDNVMRCFSIPPMGEGHSHHHPWPHYVFVYQGVGSFTIAGEYHPLRSGSWVYVPDGVEHSFRNESDMEPFVFLCNVPPRGDVNPLQAAALLKKQQESKE